MKRLLSLFFLIPYTLAATPTVIVHGGAGSVSVDRFPGKYRGTVLATQLGYNVLKAGGSAIDAVEAAIRSMEVDPNFNCGYGSVLNYDGEVEMDACLMDGSDGPNGQEPLNVGAVTGVQDIYHPITLARRVMEKTKYNFLSPKGAMALAESEKFEFLPPGSLITQRARDSLNRWKQQQNDSSGENFKFIQEGNTVGAVAIDASGNIAAGTSTGGLTGKMPGRIGDTPIVGAGTYADNRLGGLSATGTGEVIMKSVLIMDIFKRVEYLNQNLTYAAQTACDEMLQRWPDGDGGVVGVDKNGNIGIGFSSDQMSWAYQNEDRYVHYGINHGDNYVYDIERCKTQNCFPPS